MKRILSVLAAAALAAAALIGPFNSPLDAKGRGGKVVTVCGDGQC